MSLVCVIKAEKYPQGSLINMLRRRNKDVNRIFMSDRKRERVHIHGRVLGKQRKGNISVHLALHLLSSLFCSRCEAAITTLNSDLHVLFKLPLKDVIFMLRYVNNVGNRIAKQAGNNSALFRGKCK